MPRTLRPREIATSIAATFVTTLLLLSAAIGPLPLA